MPAANEAEILISDIRRFGEVNVVYNLCDYLRSVIRVVSYDKGSIVSIKKEDWTDYVGWREIHRGDIDELEAEIKRLFTFSGKIAEIELVEEMSNGTE